eukprot:SAG11_NODE_3109_length_2681_cov_3.164214_3_plen_160_part_00
MQQPDALEDVAVDFETTGGFFHKKPKKLSVESRIGPASRSCSVLPSHIVTTPTAAPATAAPAAASVAATPAAAPPKPEPISTLQAFSSVTALLESCGAERIKAELQRLGLKCGGTPMMRAERLWLTRDTPLTQMVRVSPLQSCRQQSHCAPYCVGDTLI